MVKVESVVAAVIKIPKEAMVPLLIGSGVLLVLLFAGAALTDWKRKSPDSARIGGVIAGVVLTALAIYRLVPILTETRENDHEHTGVYLVTLFDAPIIGFVAALAVVIWGWANQRIVALVVGLGIGLALLIKPFLWPLGNYYEGITRTRGVADLEHLGFIAAGVVVAITALVVGARRPAR